MKKQNIIIIIIFIIVVVIFNLICFNKSSYAKESVDNINNEFINVSVYGEVKRSGEFSIPSTWSVKDLFSYVQIKEDADISIYDLKALVRENEIYFISKKIVNDYTIERININKANKEELMTLKGIGDKTALNIIEYRKSSPFLFKEDIKNVKGIGDVLYEKIKDFITV